MDESRFWQLIDQSRREASGPWQQHQRLAELLDGLTPNEIAGFAKHWYIKHRDAYRWDLWAVAYVIEGGCSDDSFMDFRAWLIAQGKEFYESVMSEPARVADRASDGVCYERMNYVARSVYQKKTSHEIPLDDLGVPPQPTKPLGETWDEDDLPKMYPELYERFS
jgi:hypothetical protein